MASTFTMDYLEGSDSIFQMAPYHYNRAMYLVKHAPLFTFLKTHGYGIVNFSIFDLDDQRALRKDRFLSTTPGQIIFYNTFWNCARRDLWWQFFPKKVKELQQEQQQQLRKWMTRQRDYNSRVLDSLHQLADRPKEKIFVYAHLLMPHYPYFCNEKGIALPDSVSLGDSMITSKKNFSGYIAYTNQLVSSVTEKIQRSTDGQAIIMIQSDHGLADLDYKRKKDAFRNFSAFYFPSGNYGRLNDSICNVNSFRVVLNEYFGLSLKPLPARHYYIK
jgi:hypothetical protein